jgi:hypothetical protein
MSPKYVLFLQKHFNLPFFGCSRYIRTPPPPPKQKWFKTEPEFLNGTQDRFQGIDYARLGIDSWAP